MNGRKNQKKGVPFSRYATKVIKPDGEVRWVGTSLTMLRGFSSIPECNAHRFLLRERVQLVRLGNKLGEVDQGLEPAVQEILRLVSRMERPGPIGTDHLLLAVLATKSSFGSQVLCKLGIEKQALLDFMASQERER